MRRTLTVILASDVAGYSRLVADREEETIERFRQAATIFTDLVKKYQGTVFNTAGDAILAQFDSAVDATRCALDIQDANNANNLHMPEQQKLLFRIGIAIGDVLVAENGDLLGDAVNVAARLESLAEPGGICISDEVRSHVLNKIRLNVIDLGDQTLRNIPRAIRAFKLVSHDQDASGRQQPLRRGFAVGRPSTWLVAAIAILGILGVAALAWYWHPWSPNANSTIADEPFDPSKVPLVTDRIRESLANYAHEAEFKAVAISREGWGVALRAADVESAKREALDRCTQRDQKGFCRIYAIGNRVVWSTALFPLPFDVRSEPLDTPFAPEHGALIGGAIRAQRIEAYLKDKDHKAIAVNATGFWVTTNRSGWPEAARLAAERCSDLQQAPCLVISMDGFLTHRLPRSYRIIAPFTLSGENEMAQADKQRIGQIYGGKDWRALARGNSRQWYAVNGLDSETAAAEEALKACRKTETTCTLHAVGNFRVGERTD